MKPASNKHSRAKDYDAFGCRVLADRPIPFERASGRPNQPSVTLVERKAIGSEIDRSTLQCFHDAEDFPGGPRLRVYRGAGVFVVEHRDFSLRFVPEQNRIEYSVAFDTDEQFRFGLMVERVALPLFLLLGRRSILGIHGGAVALEARGWVFIGPSGVGKSTTARTLLGHGARLLADDLTLVDCTTRRILPGCPAVRLWEGEGTVGEATHDAQLHEKLAKRWFRIDSRHVEAGPAPIGGIIVLDPLSPDTTSERFRLEALRGQAAFAAVMRQVFSFSDPEPRFATRQFRNVKGLLAEHRVMRYRYRRSHTGQPTHVEPLLEALRDLGADTSDETGRP